MVAPFFEPGAVFYTDESLLKCLYGVGGISADVAVPFFNLPDASAISGVFYCNAFTVPRFFRMATRLENAEEVLAVRRGGSATPAIRMKIIHRMSFSSGWGILLRPRKHGPKA